MPSLGVESLAVESLPIESLALDADADEHNTLTTLEPNKYCMVGKSMKMRDIYESIERVAPTDTTVLISGETGTGKELVARAIHNRSHRSSRAFVTLNCAAIPEALIASELFGHEKGAFTGATHQRRGKFEAAEGGIVFLDEVGELPAETQVALLRVLQEREFERVGGSQPIRADVRVIAATNRDLESAVAAGLFRLDLFYRLNVFRFKIPPLRERKGDIPKLVKYFIDSYSRRAGKRFTTIANGTMELLESHAWPGNIRELQNVIERSVVICETNCFSVDKNWLPLESSSTRGESWPFSGKIAAQEEEFIEPVWDQAASATFSFDEMIKATEIRWIRAALKATNWNRKRAATVLKMEYKSLLYKMQTLGIRPN